MSDRMPACGYCGALIFWTSRRPDAEFALPVGHEEVDGGAAYTCPRAPSGWTGVLHPNLEQAP